MRTEIITIGDEILIGQIVDTNAAWMARELTRHGMEIAAITTVGDKQEEITTALDNGFARADVLLLTGGLGPTSDDITKHTLCQYFHTTLAFNEEVLLNIESLFLKRNIALNQLTRGQAYVPASSTVIQNNAGTAPILWFSKEGKVLVAMPGVPYEMKTTMTVDIIPRLLAQFQVSEYLCRFYLVADITESGLATLLSDFEHQLPSGFSLAYLPSLGYIRLRLSVWGVANSEEMTHQSIQLKHLLGELFVANSEKAPEALLVEHLRKKKYTISTAESCTGGYLAHRMTVLPGASDYFVGSILAYHNRIKEELLEVDRQKIRSDGVVSSEVVKQMALHVAGKMGTNCSVAVSGIMGPEGATDDKPIGTVWISTFCEGELLTRRYQVGRSREENIERTANLAILQMMKMLSGE
jgi:nicotinamide-nucleotide amidase